jgi:glycosyltransferase involved in cell wall biosynthesis
VTARPRVAVVAPLPPARTGVASYVARQVPYLAHHFDLVLAHPEPDAVDPGLARHAELVPLSALGDLAVDHVVYQLGNSLGGLDALRAAETGPPGVVVLHDGSLHHLVELVTAGTDRFEEYGDALEVAHGPLGRRLAELRARGSRGEVELALLDLLEPVLARHRRTIVHSRYLGGVVRRRLGPWADVVVVPHFAPRPSAPAAHLPPGVPAGVPLVGMAGILTPSKRPRLVLEAMAGLGRRGIDAHLLVAGEDRTGHRLGVWIDDFDVRDRVTVTGWLPDGRIGGINGLLDVAVVLRSPHLGESSGPLAGLFADGVPVVTQAIGSWAELPEGVAANLPVGGGEADALTDLLAELLANPARRAALGEAGRRYARTELDAAACAEAMVRAVTGAPAVPAEDRPPPAVWWGAALPSTARRSGTAVVVGDAAAATRLEEAAWPTRSVAEPGELQELRAGSASLVVWSIGGTDVDAGDLAAVNRVLASPGTVVALPSRAERVVGVALANAGMAELGQEGPARVVGPGGEVALLAEKRGLPAVAR